jgi:hypothetical protein
MTKLGLCPVPDSSNLGALWFLFWNAHHKSDSWAGMGLIPPLGNSFGLAR